jgi:hypothetical protein
MPILLTGLLPNVESVQYEVPSAGDTITIRQDVQCVIINPSGTLATLTIDFSNLVNNGQKVYICCSQIVTALTLDGASFNGALSAFTANGFATYIYSETATKWFRIG